MMLWIVLSIALFVVGLFGLALGFVFGWVCGSASEQESMRRELLGE